MINLYFANVGAGKTTYLVKILINEITKMNKGKSKYEYILVNFITNVDDERVIYIEDIRDIFKNYYIENALILIDEGSIVYNNRKMNMTTDEIAFFKLHRHFNCDINIVSQSNDDIDITIRRIVENIYHMRKLFCFTLIRPIRRRISIDDISKQIIDEFYFENILSYKIFYRPKYYKYFDTYERPNFKKLLTMNDLKKYIETKKVIRLIK